MCAGLGIGGRMDRERRREVVVLCLDDAPDSCEDSLYIFVSLVEGVVGVVADEVADTAE